jgi:hypothetical protein
LSARNPTSSCQTLQQMDLNSKPRRKRRWIWWLAVPAAAVVVMVTYRLMRPPELVWWSSPAIGRSPIRAKVLIPIGWKIDDERSVTYHDAGTGLAAYVLVPSDNRPKLIRQLFPCESEDAFASVEIDQPGSDPSWEQARLAGNKRFEEGGVLGVIRLTKTSDGKVYASVKYCRENHSAFNRTYKQICNSLRIE